MMIDTHAHLNFSAFEKDREQIINIVLSSGIWMINVGTKYETSEKAVEIAEKYKKGVWAAVGIHPIHLKTDFFKPETDPEEGGFKPRGEIFERKRYEDIAKSKKVVAIGEIGLDYYYFPNDEEKQEKLKEEQKKLLLDQINFAQSLNLPIIFHCRKAHNDLINILREHENKRIKGVIHSFTGRWREAKDYLKMGFYLGFNGIIYKLNLDKVIEKVPIEKILLETDCPYLTPPNFKEKRNNPLAIRMIAEEVARIKKISYKKVLDQTTKNAQNLFNFQ